MDIHMRAGGRWLGLLLAAACACSTALPSSAQDAPTPADLAVAVAAESYTLSADTELHLRMLEAVASNTHKRGDRFKLEVVEPIVQSGREIVPAGSVAEGEVVHSAKAGMAGKAGELILATRLVRVGEQQIKLRSFNAGTGKNRYNLATGLGVTLGLPALFVTGKNIAIPSGTDVYAKIASDTVVAPATASNPSEPEQSEHDDEQPAE